MTNLSSSNICSYRQRCPAARTLLLLHVYFQSAVSLLFFHFRFPPILVATTTTTRWRYHFHPAILLCAPRSLVAALLPAGKSDVRIALSTLTSAHMDSESLTARVKQNMLAVKQGCCPKVKTAVYSTFQYASMKNKCSCLTNAATFRSVPCSKEAWCPRRLGIACLPWHP